MSEKVREKEKGGDGLVFLFNSEGYFSSNDNIFSLNFYFFLVKIRITGPWANQANYPQNTILLRGWLLRCLLVRMISNKTLITNVTSLHFPNPEISNNNKNQNPK